MKIQYNAPLFVLYANLRFLQKKTKDKLGSIWPSCFRGVD
jgi:hypothetical protein